MMIFITKTGELILNESMGDYVSLYATIPMEARPVHFAATLTGRKLVVDRWDLKTYLPSIRRLRREGVIRPNTVIVRRPVRKPSRGG